jgi:1-phosphatidylinositol-4-phosphate 5-kinase
LLLFVCLLLFFFFFTSSSLSISISLSLSLLSLWPFLDEDFDINDPNLDEKRRQKLTHKREKRRHKAEKKANKLREKREKYARKQEKKKKKKYRKVGKLITKEDPSYELMFDMLLGIRICVSRVSAKRLKKRQLSVHDYCERYDVALPAKGTPETPAHPCRDFTFRDYAPRVFRLIREKFDIDSADYLVSLTGEYILQEIISPGKSGSFFYFSHDTRYMLKTITPMETAFLRRILPAYTQHIMDHPDTLLIKFYGFHCVNMRGRDKAHFVVMGNIFAQSLAIHRRYDLKGSSVGRTVGPTKRGAEGVTLKDLDLEDDIVFGPASRQVFFETMESDADFCASQGIMDYSLLLGVHSEALAAKRRKERERRRAERERQKLELRAAAAAAVATDVDAAANAGSGSDSSQSSSDEETDDDEDDDFVSFGRPTFFTQHHGGIRATDEQDQPLGIIYFMGIIDILQPYNVTKRAENVFKGIRHDRVCGVI